MIACFHLQQKQEFIMKLRRFVRKVTLLTSQDLILKMILYAT